jgi:hypothetical protein
MSSATPVSRSAASVATSVNSSTEVDLDVTGVGAARAHGHVDAGLPAVAQLGVGRGRAQREGLEHAEDLGDPLAVGVADGEVADRAVQRRGQRAAQAGVRPGLDLPRPPARADGHRAELPSSTVLPTPRRPVSTRLRSGRPRATRSSTMSNASSSLSRPASSGGRWPAPGAKGSARGPRSDGIRFSRRFR